MNTKETTDLFHTGNYGRLQVEITRGEGCRLWDSDGKEYIDALGGIAVNSLGYGHPVYVNAIKNQLDKFIHVSNFFYTEPQANLAKKLSELSGLEKVFFCNSGAEANEAAIKLTRLFQSKNDNPECEFIFLENAFHGRTMSNLAMGQDKHREGFSPFPLGFQKAVFNDINSVKKLINKKTGGIFCEPIQGEGGVTPATTSFLKELRNVCDENNILLIFDEVQSGNGRTGKYFAFEHFGVTPDILTTAKGLGAGFPVGAMMAKEDIAKVFVPGSHGSTFGGNALACGVGFAVSSEISRPEFLKNVRENGEYFISQLNEKLCNNININPRIKEIRGIGLFIGVELNEESKPIMLKMLEKGVLCSATAENVIRFVPPLIITKSEIDKVVDTLSSCLC
jgi:acetylornithine/N-succinyldiaminopimelate aminotransferase